MKKTFIIRTAEIRDACRAYIGSLSIESLWEVTIKPYVKNKSAAQRRYLHKIIGEWAKESGDSPRRLKVVMKDHCNLYGVETHPVTGKVITYMKSTESLNVKEYSFLIEQTLIEAAKLGYTFERNNDYYEAMN